MSRDATTAPGPGHGPARASFLDLAPREEGFREAVLRGLSARPRTLSATFFYDAEGSRLFDRITDQPEYYPTQTEIGILAQSGAEMADLLGPGCQVIELGSGSSVKVRLLLDRLKDPAGYVGIDISRAHLRAACDRLAADYPGLDVLALCADCLHPEFLSGIAVPPPASRLPGRRVVFFPGSTIGNLDPVEALAFLSLWGRWLRRAGPRAADERPGGLLVGVDLRKDPALLHAAYNDAAGVTAAFNLNLLARINRELGGSFDLDAFAHRAFYDSDRGRVEMHLVSRRDQIVRAAGRSFAFQAGETIHTENSYKYTLPGFAALGARAGLRAERTWTDPDGLFALFWLVA
ncbi:L-histidine N(alpha)-methyltransferase [Rhodocista pekingensis]|uniref:L-histidine N(Alpha)-methyltransferase n=1 Tax=Rhodocista pekingensis TaxID=201185 RepID=A0ABW2KPC0_9PROT